MHHQHTSHVRTDAVTSSNTSAAEVPASFAEDNETEAEAEVFFGLGDTFAEFSDTLGPSMLGFLLETKRTFLHLIRPELNGMCRRALPRGSNWASPRVRNSMEPQGGSESARASIGRRDPSSVRYADNASGVRRTSRPNSNSASMGAHRANALSPLLLHMVPLGTPLFDVIPSHDASMKLHEGGPPVAVNAGDIGACTLVMTVFDRRDQMLDRLLWYQPLLCLRSIVRGHLFVNSGVGVSTLILSALVFLQLY